MEHHKVVIIGSGPAGYTAAIYTARANLEPVLYEGGGALIEPLTLPGGQLMLTTEVENYPGFPEGIQGPEMMTRFFEQAERFGTELIREDVKKVEFKDKGPFRLLIGSDWYEARTVILAMGATAKWLN